VIEQHPQELDRRLSRLDHGQTPLHFAITRKRVDILALLIELGADVDAVDTNRQTAVEYAMLRGDRDATAGCSRLVPRSRQRGTRPRRRTRKALRRP
jgi:ankyrin repeat protein